MVRFLRQGILDIKNTEKNNNTEKIAAFKLHLETILNNQQHRKEGAINKFIDFQNIHKKLTTNIQQLLNQDVHVFCKDIKKIKKRLLEELV